MNLPEHLNVPDLLRYITEIANHVSIRLAVTWDKQSGKWVGRNLLVDVFPGDWLSESGKSVRGYLSEYDPPRMPPLIFPERAVFLRQMVKTQVIKEWLTEPQECRLDHYDPSPGQDTKALRFSLPDFAPQPPRQRLNSNTPDNYAELPWPHYNYYFILNAGSPYYPADSQSLYKPNQHFEDLRDACAQLIHDFKKADYPWPQYNYQHEITIRVVDDDGWITNIRQPASGTVVISVGGRTLDPGHLILKRNDGHDINREFGRPTSIAFDVPVGSPRLRFILGNAVRSLDEAWFSPRQDPVSERAQPLSRVEDGQLRGLVPLRSPADYSDLPLQTNDTKVIQPGAVPPVPAKKTRAKPAEPRLPKLSLLKVFVASPMDVKRERAAVPKVLEGLNRGLARQFGLYLEDEMWEKRSVPGLHKDGPQAQVEESLEFDKANIVIGIFWWRFGTPVGDAKSGTERELMRAIESWQKTSQPDVLVYFSQKAYKLNNPAEAAQWGAVLEFQKTYSDLGLWKPYPNGAKFPEILRADLEHLLQMRYGNRRRRS